jgi:P-type conjugative transfer protein TrbJ
MKKIFVSLMICFHLTVPSTSSAGLPVLDISNLIQSIMTVIQQLQEIEAMYDSVSNLDEQIGQLDTQITNQYTEITNQSEQIANQERSLDMLSNGDWGSYRDLLNGVQSDISSITGSVDSLTYAKNSIQGNYDNIFKKDYANLNPDQRSQALADINNSMHEVTYNAMRAQAVVERIAGSSQKAKDILAQSEAADGEVRQLQSLTQMSSLTVSSLNDLVTVSATTGRVIAAEQARATEERELMRVSGEELRQGYADKGPAGTKKSKFPGM